MTVAECCYGLLITWLLLAPSQYYGFGLGATGLAIKTVFVQCITVNCYLWLASHCIPFGFWRNLLHQGLALIVFLAVAYISREITAFFPLGESFSLLRFLASGLLYTIGTCVLLLFFPQILGFSRTEFKELVSRFLAHAWH